VFMLKVHNLYKHLLNMTCTDLYRATDHKQKYHNVI